MSDSDDDIETKFTMTISEADARWLEKTYPGAKTNQERIRMAISDARLFRRQTDSDS